MYKCNMCLTTFSVISKVPRGVRKLYCPSCGSEYVKEVFEEGNSDSDNIAVNRVIKHLENKVKVAEYKAGLKCEKVEDSISALGLRLEAYRCGMDGTLPPDWGNEALKTGVEKD